MSAHIENRREYVLAKVAITRLRHAIRDLHDRLPSQSDPLAYKATLIELAEVERELDHNWGLVADWKLRSGTLTCNRCESP